MDEAAVAVAVPSWLEITSTVVDTIAGVATAVAVVVAVYELFWRRRSDRHDERRGDAAADALVTLARECRAVIGRCMLLQEHIGHGRANGADALPAATDGAEFFAKIERWLFADVPDAMYEAELKTTALLTRVETTVLNDLSESTNSLLNELSGRFGRLRPLTNPEEIASMLASMNASLEQWVSRFEAIEQRGRAVLGPVAQLRAKHQ